MAKIIEINNQVISIGTDDGKIKEIRASDINFVPHLGDEVEIFETDTKIIVSKVEPKNTIPNGGININLANTQTNNAPQPTLVTNKKVVNKIAYCILAFLHFYSADLAYINSMPAKPEQALLICFSAGLASLPFWA